MHARLIKPQTRFSYQVVNLLIDIDCLEEARRQSRLFSIRRFNVLSFNPDDHGERDGDLRAHVDAILDQAGLATRPTRIMLLCYPRVFGFAFNPLSIFFAYDASGDLVAAIYEVRNTIGQRHSYVAPAKSGELDDRGLRQERDKIFYVSPFQSMALRYRFRVKPPAEKVAIRILALGHAGPVLAATFHGEHVKLRTCSVVRLGAVALSLPVKVLGGIYWQALKLWIRGARYERSPEPPPTHSLGEAGPFSGSH